MSKTWSAVQKTINFSAIYLGAKQALTTLKEMTNASVDYTETVNLFNVSFGKGLEGLNEYYEQAIDFQERLEEKLGVNIEESMRYQALFNSMTKSMGLGANYAYTLSENMTKLGYDLASLYNIDPESAMTKLRAGLAGQTEPLRELGLDITEQSLKPVAESLGVTESIRNMSQAEKAVLRYITVLRQAQIAQGDFARTMVSPANQLRIFNAQVTAFKRNMGNLWQGFLGGLLPYVNAIMLVINELLKMVAKLFNFKVSEQPVNISASVGLDDLTDDLGTAEKKAKALKAQLLGFDEINNITLENNSNAGSAGGASVGGIDQRLLDALKGYDNLMDSVSNKATEIRDKILDWLGFTRDVNGELKWSWKDMNGIAKTITIISGLIGGIYIIGKITKLVQWIKTLTTVLKTGKGATTTFGLGIQTIGKFINGTKTGFSNLKAWISMVVEQYKIFRTQGNGVVSSLKQTHSQLKSTGQGFSSLIPNTVKVGAGLVGLATSSVLAYKSMQDLSSGTIGTGEAMLKLTGSIAGATASGALIGSVFGPAGTIVGALAGALISGVSALVGWETESEIAISKTEDFRKSIQDSYNAMLENNKKVQEYGNSMNTEVDKVERLKSKLSELVDENGKVKKGYEDRAEFILGQLNNALGTEFTLNDLIKGKYEEIIQTIDKVIAKKKQETMLTMFEEKYTQAMKDRAGALQKVEETTNNLNDALGKVKGNKYEEDILKLYDSWNNLSEAEKQAQGNFANYSQSVKDDAWWWQIDMGKETGSIIDNLSAQDEALRQNKAVVKQYSQDIVNYNQALTLSEEGKTNELALLYDEQVFNVNEAGEQIVSSHKNTIRGIGEGIKEYKIILENGTEAQKKAAEEEIKIEEDKLREICKTLKGQATAIKEMTPEIVEDWKQMAISSKDVYNEQISTMPPDTKMFLQLINGEIDASSPDVVDSFSKMATDSKEDFNKGLELLPEDTRGKIVASVMAVTGMTESTRSAYESLSETGKNAFNNAMSSMDTDARNKVQSAIDEINGKAWEMGQAGGNAGGSADTEFNNSLGDTRQSAVNFLAGFGRYLSGTNPRRIIWRFWYFK